MFTWLLLLSASACSSAEDGAARVQRHEGADASGIEDARLEDHSGDSTRSDASTSRTCPSASSDAASVECTPDEVWPLVVQQDGFGNCTATLPDNIDTNRLSIETGMASHPARAALQRLDAPCADQPGWYLVNDSTIEICVICSGNFSVNFWAVVGCGDDSLDGSAADACVPEIVTVPMRLEAAGCFMDLLPNADWCVPLSITLPFGIGGGTQLHIQVPYMPSPSCDDPANTGWQPVNESTLRLCAGACMQPPFYEGSPFKVTLECGATSP